MTMQAAITVDDLPHWNEYPYPPGHSARSVADALIAAFASHGVRGVYAFANSARFDDAADNRRIIDDWVAAGHHVGNHTHSHPILHLVDADTYLADIERADERLAPWLARAPARFFRYTWNIRGETESKFETVRQRLAALDYRPAECSSMFFEWDWDLAYVKCLERGDNAGIEFLKQSFLDFAPRQLAHDDAGMRRVFGRAVPHILLLHNLSFVELILDELLDSLADSGVEYIPLEAACADEAYGAVAEFPCGEFMNYWRKLLWRDGIDSDELPRECTGVHARVLRMGEDR